MRLRGEKQRLPGQLDQAVLPDGRRAGPQHQQSGLSLAVREMPKLDGKTDEAKRSALADMGEKALYSRITLTADRLTYLTPVPVLAQVNGRE